MKHNLIIPISMLVLCSCSDGGGGGKSPAVPHISQAEEAVENPDGTYLAAFKPLNEQTGTLLGALTLVKEGDKFLADIRVNNGQPNVVHRQNIYIGNSCPTKLNDLNNDGFIDIIEAIPALKGILLPLDGDLNSQIGSGDYWPVGDQYGFYLWGKTASYSSLMQDLWKTDENADDYIVKLNKDSSLDLSGKVILIQGVSETQFLPETVATMGGLNKFQTLPVACAIIAKIKTGPGVIETTDELSLEVPVGETVGGSSGAEDGSIDRYASDYTTGGVAQ